MKCGHCDASYVGETKKIVDYIFTSILIMKISPIALSAVSIK